MATSGVSAFNLDITDIIEEAHERIGREFRSGYDALTARRSLNLLFQDFINQGIHYWQIEQILLPAVVGTASYTLAADTSDIVDAKWRRSGNDIEITRTGLAEYLAIPTKTTAGRPSQWFLDRQRDAPVLYLWPVPDTAGDSFLYWRIRYFQDFNSPTNTADAPRRFLPAIASGLAYHLADKNPATVDGARRAELFQRYQIDVQRALEEDRDRSSWYATPDLRRSY